MSLSLANAGRTTSDVDYISAYGPGHPVLDAAEVRYIKEVFRHRAYSIPISSIKGVGPDVDFRVNLTDKNIKPITLEIIAHANQAESKPKNLEERLFETDARVKAKPEPGTGPVAIEEKPPIG